jgi:hypothetical protein
MDTFGIGTFFQEFNEISGFEKNEPFKWLFRGGRICKLSLHLWGRTSGLPVSGGSAADWSFFICSIKNRP